MTLTVEYTGSLDPAYDKSIVDAAGPGSHGRSAGAARNTGAHPGHGRPTFKIGDQLITADQIILHAIGDYVLQSDWMANEKTKRAFPAFCHAIVYSLPFFIFQPTLSAWLVIFSTHFLIDRYRLARYVTWAKNFISPPGTNAPWSDCTGTGYPSARPAWLAVWLLIFADNIMHIVINGVALRFL